jgi:hypothetical protein
VSKDAEATLFRGRERFKKVSVSSFNLLSVSEYLNFVVIRPSRERNQ